MVFFYSKCMKPEKKTYGYYCITIDTFDASRLMQTNNERAFIISQLQDLLSPRLIIDTIPTHRQLASCIDLLAFSITGHSIQLLIFSVDVSIVTYFANDIAVKLTNYQQGLLPRYRSLPSPCIRIKKLRGPHQALAWSVKLHSRHKDWEYDRYSSIGFYLHDRRGDWMRFWRLTQLYENESAHYRLLIDSLLENHAGDSTPTRLSYAS